MWTALTCTVRGLYLSSASTDATGYAADTNEQQYSSETIKNEHIEGLVLE
jgi:hypothetical protein